jgi:hypothetical protein
MVVYDPAMIARPADASETGALARLWYDGWQDARAAILPPRARTRESFAERMAAALADVRVIGPQGAPLGFAMLKGDELYQFYMASEARGAGVAAVRCQDEQSGTRASNTISFAGLRPGDIGHGRSARAAWAEDFGGPRNRGRSLERAGSTAPEAALTRLARYTA